jgi:predicted GNAT family acetyltransferase
MHPLDRPIWSALNTVHAGLSRGGPLAKRYAPDVNVFAATGDDSPAALAALEELMAPGEQVYLLQVPAISIPRGLKAVKRAAGVQMMAGRAMAQVRQDDVVALAEADAPEMLALARLTEPGPFRLRTRVMGDFIGIRIDGRLAAMAGERFRFPGHTEVSAVCTHPDFRGRGLARRLSTIVAAKIAARGETPFLHAWASNAPAITLYESLGFVLRSKVDVAVLERA